MENDVNEYASMDWKVFTIRAIDALRWPAAFAFAFFLVREPIGRLIAAVAVRIGT